MTHSLVVVDDFHPEPLELREAVISSEFKTEIGPDGMPYTGISRYEDKRVYDLIADAMGSRVTPRISCWRISYAGELANTFVHADGICADWAGLLYLNTPEQCTKNWSGTAFFRHRGLGIDAMPSDETIRASGVDVAAFKAKMEQDWQRQEPWEMGGFIGMRFNRFVAYPTSRFHSRWPSEAFGSIPQDGRLILACFFDIDPVVPSVTG